MTSVILPARDPSGTGGTVNPSVSVEALTGGDVVERVIWGQISGGAWVPLGTNANPVQVADGGGSLTVDAPVGTPAFVRLSDGSAAITTLPVSVAALPLPAGAATQTTLAALLAALGSPMQASGGSVAIAGTVPVSGPLTDAQLRASAVPVTGSLSVGAAADVVASGSLTTAGDTVTATGLAGYATMSVYLENTTTGATSTCIMEGSPDGGTSWVTLGLESPQGATVSFTSFSVGSLAPQLIGYVRTAGYDRVRIRAAAYSGTAATMQLRTTTAMLPYRGVQVTSGNITASLATGSNTIGALAFGANSIGLVGLNAGSNLVGKVGIDQTTPGTTDSVSVKGPLPAHGDIVGSGSLTALNQAVTLTLSGQSTLVYDVSGTFTATYQVQVSIDGANYQALPVGVDIGDIGANIPTGTSLTTAARKRVSVAGYASVRIICTAFTSGTLVVAARATAATGQITPATAIPIGQGGNVAVVKAASTAAVAGDASQVVSISPNNGAKLTDAGGTTQATIKAASTAAAAADTSLVVGLSPNSPITNPTGTLQAGSQVAVTTTAGTLVAAGTYKSIALRNLSSSASSVFIGPATVTPTTGMEIKPGEFYSYGPGECPSNLIQAICASGSATVIVQVVT